MAGLSKRLKRPQAAAACDVGPGPGACVALAHGDGSEIGMGAAGAPDDGPVGGIGTAPDCAAGHDDGDGPCGVAGLEGAPDIAPAAGELFPALQPEGAEGAASSSSTPSGRSHEVPGAGPGPGPPSSGLGQTVAAKGPKRKLWITPPVVNKVIPQGAALVLDLTGRRWKGSFASHFTCSKSWTLTGFNRRSALEYVVDELWRVSGAERPHTAYVDQTPLEEWCGNLNDEPISSKRPRI